MARHFLRSDRLAILRRMERLTLPGSSIALARDASRLLFTSFTDYQDGFRAVSRHSARHFASRDWQATRHDAAARLALYREHVDRALAELSLRLGVRANDMRLWESMRDGFAGLLEGRDDAELGETFFNSITRRVFATIGVESSIEFVRHEGSAVLPDDESASRWCTGDTAEALAEALFMRLPHHLADMPEDARRVGHAIRDAVRAEWGVDVPDGARYLPHVFYRNTAAYVVARLECRGQTMPLVIALLNDDLGVYADAVLTTADEASIVFGFSWSYFHVDAPKPRQTVSFLASIMPQKRVDELYTSIGYNKHGKTELYRALLDHLQDPGARFEEAEGTKGLVMTVFTLPSLNIVFKVIRDSVGHPKRTTRREVMEKYRFVFYRDRVGRLADAQEFEHLEFPRRCFPDVLLDELTRSAPSIVSEAGDHVVVNHLYTERRLRPLNLYLREVPRSAAEDAIIDYGNAIRDLAAADIFTGDMLLKNFGVSRHGRVIFYDYDELATLTECRFRSLPEPNDPLDEMSAEPWFSLAEHDVFPEEFAPFLIPEGPLRETFLEAHAELLQPEWWRSIQHRLRAGELFDTFPYPPERRLRHDEGRPIRLSARG